MTDHAEPDDDWGRITFDRAHEIGVTGVWCWCYTPDALHPIAENGEHDA